MGETIEQRTSGWKALRGFVAALAAHSGAPGLWTAGLILSAALLDGAGLLLLAPLIGAITGGGAGAVQHWITRLLSEAGFTGRRNQLWVLLAVFLVVAILRALANKRRDIALAELQTGFAQAERNRLITVLANAPWPRLLRLKHSQTTALLSTEVQRLANAGAYLMQASAQIALLAVQMIVALLLAPALAAPALFLLAMGTIVFAASSRRIHQLGDRVVEANQAMMASAAALLGGLKSAIAQNAQHAFVVEFEATQAALSQNQLAFAGWQARGRMTYSILSVILAVTLVAIGAGMFAVPAATLLTMVLVFSRMGPLAQQLYQSAQTLMFTVPAFEHIRRTEHALQPAGDRPKPVPVQPASGAIVLSGVTYLHDGGGGVRNVDLVLEPGCFVGIGGPSGAGKTTLADLIAGLLEPQEGAITIGVDRLDDARRDGWSESIAYVTQDGFLFHDTVRRNLTWGAGTVDEVDIADALKLVGAEALVAGLGDGLDTVIGERGAILSGGERQRLVLARALLRRPRLLILDEAANAIDLESELLLLEGLKKLDPRPTILMISHREQSLEHCDAIVRVDRGSVRKDRKLTP